MDVKLPNGTIIKGVPEGTTKEQVAQKAIAAGLATPQDFGVPAEQQAPNGIMSSIKDAVTGQSRSTPEIELLPPIGNSPELNSLNLDALKASAVGLFGSDESLAKVLQSMGGVITQDAKGNMIAELPSGKYAINKPGLSPSDVASGVAQAGAFALAGAAAPATVVGQGLAAGGASLGMQGAVSGLGGEDVNLKQVGIDAALGAGGQAIANSIDVARRIATGSAANEAADFAAKNNLPIMTSDILPPESALARGVRNIGEQVPIVGTSAARGEQQVARVSQIEGLRNIYPEATDDQIYQSFVNSGNKYKAVMGSRYDNIAKQMGEVPIQINKTISAIDDELAKLTAGGVIKDADTISKLQTVKDDLLSGEQTFKSLRDNRTFVRENLKAEKPSSQADRVIDRVYSAMTDDITDAVSATAGRESADKLKQVDALFAAEKNAQKKTKLKNILAKGDVKPEEATKAVFSSDLSDVKKAYAALDNKGRAITRAAIINKVISSAEDAAGEVSPEKFLSGLKRYDKQFGVFFKGAERKQLDGLRDYLNATRRASQVKLDPSTGQKLVPLAMTGTVVSDIAGGTAGLASGSFATIAALSRAYESKPVMKAMLKLASTPKASPAYQNAANGVRSSLIAAQQEGEK